MSLSFVSQASATTALFSRRALAAHLGVSLRTLDNMVKDRAFPKGERIGRRKYWTHTSVDKWLLRKFGVQEAWRG